MSKKTIRVLVVDDEEEDFLIVATLLDRATTEYTVEWVSNYDLAVVALADPNRADVALVDYRLGARNGLDLIASAKEIPAGAPMILLTGYGDTAIDAEALQAGAADYIPKADLGTQGLDRSIRYTLDNHRANQQLAVTLGRVEALLDAIPDDMFRVDRTGTFHDYHRGVEMDLHRSPEAFLGRTVTDVLPPPVARPAMVNITAAIDSGELQVFEYQLTVNGARADFEARVFPIPSADQAIMIVRDITDRKTVEYGLRATIVSKDDFLATVGHGLRTPLTSILGFAHLLHDRTLPVTSDEHHDMIATIIEQASNLADIVEDIIVSSRAEIGELSIVSTPIDLWTQAESVIQASADPTGRIASLPSPRDPVAANGDAQRVRQIIRNLVNNALNYGGEAISLEASSSSGAARIRVIDNGPGLPPGQADIFAPYQRRHPRGGSPDHIGIGLTISRQLAQLMGGDLTHMRHSGDTVFELTLPAAQP